MKQKIVFIILVFAILATQVCNVIHYNKGEALFILLSVVTACITLYSLQGKTEEEFEDSSNIVLNVNLLLSVYVLAYFTFFVIGTSLAIIGALLLKLFV